MTGAIRWRPGALVLAAVTLLACAACLGWLSREGERGRVHRPGLALCDPAMPVRAVRTAREGHAVLAAEGGRGRVVVSASRFLHFQPADDDDVWRAARRFPLAPRDLAGLYADRVEAKNALWVALWTGIARELVHVVPPSTWPEKRAAAVADPADVVSSDAEHLVLHHWGSRRVVTAAVPSPGEPVLLEVDASYFDRGDPAELVRRLRLAGLRADLVVLDAAEDNPDVTAAGRAGLASFARALCAEGERGR